MSELRIAAVQHDITWNDRDANFERLAPRIAGAIAIRFGFIVGKAAEHEQIVTVPGETEVYSEGLIAGRLKIVRRGARMLGCQMTEDGAREVSRRAARA